MPRDVPIGEGYDGDKMISVMAPGQHVGHYQYWDHPNVVPRDGMGLGSVTPFEQPMHGMGSWASSFAGLGGDGMGDAADEKVAKVKRLLAESRSLRDFEMRIRGAIVVQMDPGVKTSITAIHQIRRMLLFEPELGGREFSKETPLRERLDDFYVELSRLTFPVSDNLLDLASEHELVYIELEQMWQEGATRKIKAEIQRLDEQIKSRERRMAGIEDSIAAQIVRDLPEAAKAGGLMLGGLFGSIPWYGWLGAAAVVGTVVYFKK